MSYRATINSGRHHTRIYCRKRNGVWDRRSPELMREQMFTPGNKFALLGALDKLRKATASFFMSVRLSVCSAKEQLRSQWTDFHEFWYLSTFRKYVEKIQVLFPSDKNDRYFILKKPKYILFISRSILRRRRNVSDKLSRETQNTFHVQKKVFFFWNRIVYGIACVNIVERERPQVAARASQAG